MHTSNRTINVSELRRLNINVALPYISGVKSDAFLPEARPGPKPLEAICNVPISEETPVRMKVLIAVAKVTRVPMEYITGKERGGNIVMARKIFAYICRTFYAMSFERIGKFIKRDHTTVISLVSSVNRNPEKFTDKIDAVRTLIGV